MDEFGVPEQQDNAVTPGALLVPLTRIGERVAALEARSSAEIGALKKDTEVIRMTMHATNDTMTAFVGQQIAANSEFKTLSLTLADHIKLCDRRGQVLNRAAWVGVMTLLAILGYLLGHGLPWNMHP